MAATSVRTSANARRFDDEKRKRKRERERKKRREHDKSECLFGPEIFSQESQ